MKETIGSRLLSGPLVLVYGVLLTALLYWPGLTGGFLLDDYPFIKNNPWLFLDKFDIYSLLQAADSFPASHQGRWLTMVSFSLNIWFGGLDSYYFKLVNLLIHLFNGWLIYKFVKLLVGALCNESLARKETVAAFVAIAWMVLPINLTAVLYSVQRLESLSITFVLFGLWLYTSTRVEKMNEPPIARLFIILFVSTLLGSLAKESAVLLPVYACIVEIALAGKVEPAAVRAIRRFYVFLFTVAVIIGVAWLLTWLGTSRSYLRDFTMIERVLTEQRVLVFYQYLTFFPSLSSLSLFHDDFVISKGLLTPVSTFTSVAFNAFLLLLAWVLRKHSPLFFTGIFFYYSGHALTASVIPLELVFEHRNYFPSLGLIIACYGLIRASHRFLSDKLVAALALSFVSFWSGVTGLRAVIWSDPVGLALHEYESNPNSVRAHSELIRLLMLLSGDEESPLFDRAHAVADSCLLLNSPRLTCEMTSVALHEKTGRALPESVWRGAAEKVSQLPPLQADVTGLRAIFTCYTTLICKGDHEKLGLVLEVAAQHDNAPAELYLLYSHYLTRFGGSSSSAEKYVRKAISQRPDYPDALIHLGSLLISAGELEEVESVMEELRRINRFKKLDKYIAGLEQMRESRFSVPLSE